MPTPAPESPPPYIRANEHIYDDYFQDEFTTALDTNVLQLLDRVRG